MKKLLCIFGFIAVSTSSYAQFSYSNQWAVTAAGGITQKGGFNAQLGFDTSFGLSIHGLQARAIFYSLKVRHDLQDISYQRYALHINYSLSLDRAIKSSFFFINVTAGAVIGYDNVPSIVGETLRIKTSSSLIAGINVAPQFEFKIIKGLHIYVEPRFSYLFVSSIYNYDIAGNIGLKLYL